MTPSEQDSVRDLADKDRDMVMRPIRDALYDCDDLYYLARVSGRSLSCLHAIRSDRTRWPRWDTVFTLVRQLDLRLMILPRGNR